MEAMDMENVSETDEWLSRAFKLVHMNAAAYVVRTTPAKRAVVRGAPTPRMMVAPEVRADLEHAVRYRAFGYDSHMERGLLACLARWESAEDGHFDQLYSAAVARLNAGRVDQCGDCAVAVLESSDVHARCAECG